MRDIKFRAWHGGHKYAEPGMFYDEKPGDCLVYNNQGQNIIAIMQYTGIKDRNGKGREMYEGDIYKQDSRHYVIEWSEYSCGWIVRNLNSKSTLPGLLQGEIAIYDDYEYIGSIYEHPHLLNKEETTK